MLKPEHLHVVTAISNPCRYRSRYKLYNEFAKRVADAGATLWTVEMAFGERPHEVTQEGNPHHIQVRSDQELWHKENLLNIGISRLPHNWKYVATIDADLNFTRADWVQETLHQLQHHPVVQMFSEVSNLGPNHEFLGHGISFVEAWKRGMAIKTEHGMASNRLYHHPKMTPKLSYPYPGGNLTLGSPGGAWAYRRDAIDALGGLIDDSLVGSADYFMAASLFGFLDLILADGYTPGFVASLKRWEARALRAIRHDVGLVPGLVIHSWHGRMAQRGYGERWRILIEHQFDPHTDLSYDFQGLQLVDDGSDRMRKLRDDVQSYMHSRNEDTCEV